MTRPLLKAVCYGPPGAGKSTFASKWPKPILVICTDPRGKEGPYLEAGDVREDDAEHSHVFSRKTGNLLIRLEYFDDDFDDMKTNSARARLFRRFEFLHREVHQWNTIVFDSVSSFELVSRMYDSYTLNAKGERGRSDAPYITSAGDLEDIVCHRFPRYRTNVLAICHEDEIREKVGTGKNAEWVTVGYRPALPGKIGNFKLASQYGEYYRLYLRGNEHLLQTVKTGKHLQIRSGIKAPDPCYPHYEALWENYDKEHQEKGTEKTAETENQTQ